VSPTALSSALEAPGGELGQAIAVLRAAGHPEPETLALGSGDRLLLELLREVTGGDLELTARCARCGVLNAAVVDARSVPPSAPRDALLGAGGGLRQPTYADLLDLPPDRDEAIGELLRRCVVGTPALTPSAARLQEVDDALTGPLVLACAGCGGRVEVDLDVQAAVLERLARHARAVDVEIHLLAGAYGWSLAEITALPDARRSALARLVAEDR
jgi:hypothetical protein